MDDEYDDPCDDTDDEDDGGYADGEDDDGREEEACSQCLRERPAGLVRVRAHVGVRNGEDVDESHELFERSDRDAQVERHLPARSRLGVEPRREVGRLWPPSQERREAARVG